MRKWHVSIVREKKIGYNWAYCKWNVQCQCIFANWWHTFVLPTVDTQNTFATDPDNGTNLHFNYPPEKFNVGCLYKLFLSSNFHCVHLQKTNTMNTVNVMPAYLIHLSPRCLLSIRFNTELDSPTVLRTSKAFRCALYTNIICLCSG